MSLYNLGFFFFARFASMKHALHVCSLHLCSRRPLCSISSRAFNYITFSKVLYNIMFDICYIILFNRHFKASWRAICLSSFFKVLRARLQARPVSNSGAEILDFLKCMFPWSMNYIIVKLNTSFCKEKFGRW